MTTVTSQMLPCPLQMAEQQLSNTELASLAVWASSIRKLLFILPLKDRLAWEGCLACPY